MAGLQPTTYDVVVIGGGPAGLAAVGRLARWSTLLVDAGPRVEVEKDRRDPETRFIGAGGASIVNDGKWSWGLAGSASHALPHVASAKAELLDLLGLPHEPTLAAAAAAEPAPGAGGAGTSAGGTWRVKAYPSVRTPLADRQALVVKLQARAERQCACLWDTRCVDVCPVASAGGEAASPMYEVRLEPAVAAPVTPPPAVVLARTVIVATGRFGPLSLPMPSLPSVFRRCEVGVRVCGHNAAPLFALGTPRVDDGVLDPKWIMTDTVGVGGVAVGVEYRSFCWCHDGEVVVGHGRRLGGRAASVTALSGRADGDVSTSQSSVGVMARVVDGATAAAAGLLDEFEQVLAVEPFQHGVPSLAAVQPAVSSLPPGWRAVVAHGVQAFAAAVLPGDAPQPDGGYTVAGPCIEGVGHYLDAHPDAQLWVRGHAGVAVAGDASGTFRGLVPAFVSGVSVAEGVAAALEEARLAAFNRLADQVRGWAGPPVGPPPPPAVIPAPALQPAGAATHVMLENHTFLAPLNPPPGLIATYHRVVDAYNDAMAAVSGRLWKAMKPPVLALLFRDAGGDDGPPASEADGKLSATVRLHAHDVPPPPAAGKYVTVMQSARYCPGNDLPLTMRQAYTEDAALFAVAGFNVVRVKVEVSAHGVAGLPDDAASAQHYLDNGWYSEDHIRVKFKGADPTTLPGPAELAALDRLAVKLQLQMGIPVALSYNHRRYEKPELGIVTGRQRFLNIRHRRQTRDFVLARVADVRAQVAALPDWELAPPIDEWVLHDSNRGMDRGWIDPMKWTVVCLSGKRFSGKDTFAACLHKAATAGGVHLETTSFALELKREYCAMHGLDLDAFLTDQELKDGHRAALTALFDRTFAEEPDRYAHHVCAFVARLVASGGLGVVVVTDLRYRRHLEVLRKRLHGTVALRTVRVEVDDKVRMAHGWTPSAYDTHACEVDMDAVTDWTHTVDNSGSVDGLQQAAATLLGRIACSV